MTLKKSIFFTKTQNDAFFTNFFFVFNMDCFYNGSLSASR